MTFYKKIQNYYRRAFCMGHFPSFFTIIFSRKKKLIYYGFLGDGNFGDELVYIATKALFEKDLLIPYKKHMPIHTKILLGSIPNLADGVIIGGGTLFRNFHGEHKFYSKMIAMKKSLFFHGTGADYNFDGYDFWKILCSTKIFGGVRGPLSKQNISDRQIDLDVTGDAAFYLFDETLNVKKATKTILINFGTHVYDSRLEKSRNLVESFLMSDKLKDYNINYLPFHEIDLSIGKELITRHPRINILEIPTTFAEGLEHFNAAEFIIGERLHFVIMSALANAPFLSINYDLKHLDFLLSIKAERFGFIPQDLKMEDIYKLFESRNTIYNWNEINSSIKNCKSKMKMEYTLFQNHI